MLALGANLLGLAAGMGVWLWRRLVLLSSSWPKCMPNERCLTSALPRPGHSLLADAERRAGSATNQSATLVLAA
jgi:hypothetical protein